MISKQGKASKSKGKRGEYTLRDHLRLCGWKADRVYASGALKGMPGDVKACKDGRTLIFELKVRKDQFDKIYQLYAAHMKATQNDVLAVALPGAKKLCVEMCGNLDGVLDSDGIFELCERSPLYAEFKRQFESLITMQAWVKEADILVIKGDRKPLLFLRYR